MNTRVPMYYLLAALLGLGIAAARAAPETQRVQSQSTEIVGVTVTESDRVSADVWGLSIEEWKRYERLKKGLAGYRANKLGPLLVLGIHARSKTERRHYAKQLARMEAKRIKRVLRFQTVYSHVWDQVYPNFFHAVQLQSLLSHPKPAGLSVVDLIGNQRRIVFVRAENCPACQAAVRRLAQADKPMDIYFVDAETDAVIRQWAKAVGLDPKQVRSGAITLNHATQSITQKLTGAPLPVVLKRGK